MAQEINLINEFRERAKSIENKRTTLVIEIIKTYNHIIKDITYMVPNQITVPTDDEI